MKLRLTFLFIAYTIIIAACKKDNIDNYPHVLKATGFVTKGDLRVYAYGGAEIKNKAVIQRFTNPWPTPEKDYKPGTEDVITFLSKDTVTFGTSSLKYSVKRKGDRFVFYSEYPVFVGYEQVMDPYIAETSETIPIDGASGYNPRRKDVRVAYGTFKNISLSFLVYKIYKSKSGVGSNFSITQGAMYNEIRKNNLSNLSQGDTLAIQEFTIDYKN